MSWRTSGVIDERMSFIVDWQSDEWPMAELCRRYGVSRKTGYKLVARFRAEGLSGLEDRSHARHHHPNATDAATIEAVLQARADHPHWGPKKLKAWLGRKDLDLVVPAASTIGALLKRHGLVVRRRRVGRARPSASLNAANAANDVWGIDFKGWFRTGDGARCDPLSLSDLASRYLLRVQALDRPDGAHVWPVLDAAFREYGLPRAMRSDNGAPFASTGAGGLTELAVKLIKAGVMPERIRPGKPQENGRHERMHRTLKRETAQPPARSLAAQQRRFDAFRREFNQERPHEALEQQTPAEHFSPSPRRYSGRLREPDYEGVDHIRRVHLSGDIRWRGERIFISEALVHEPVGMIEREDGGFDILYGPIVLGQLNHKGTFLKARTPLTRHDPPTAPVTHQPG